MFSQLDHTHFEELHSLCQLILSRFPVSEHFFLGIGRSPAPVIAAIQHISGKDNATLMPISFQGYTSSSFNPHMHWKKSVCLYQKFCCYIPPDKKIVILDWAASGSSLAMAISLMQSFLAASEFIGLALAKESAHEKIESNIRITGAICSLCCISPKNSSILFDSIENGILKRKLELYPTSSFGLIGAGYKAVADLEVDPSHNWKIYQLLLAQKMNRLSPINSAADSFFTCHNLTPGVYYE
ncbi:hypothetical protein [Pelagibaculum spongiae]|uniref:Uncharacterized protein n=1 Tax=Pelagibaculum spongiae TaxID=2080658 RepID=A0A2V1GZ38_9GAMM|nr:hypothetical protein [Pelagibaculum spongiae]PVZ72314.1 hypothetical protein DC094_04720 [Pelagibaculum spongiae]